jgi:RNA polymerase sigma-70 factor (ECF subfamily)
MDAFKQLLDNSYAKVFYHSLKQVKNGHDAADITQNTFLKAFLYCGAVRNPASLEAWLFTVCNNEIKQFFRNRAKIMPPHNTPAAASHDALYAAIDQLSDKQRQIILLKYFGGYSVKELALLLSVGAGTVKSRLYEARQALKRILDTLTPVPLSAFKNERRNALMATLQLYDTGAKTIPCMSLHAQRQLLACAKENVKFGTAVLEELAAIPTGQEFMDSSGGKLSYNELLYILARCDDATIYRISGTNFKTWRSATDNPLVKDIAKLCKTGCFIDSVEPIVYVPSLRDTAAWYKKYLNWACDGSEESDDKWQHRIINCYANADNEASYQGFKGIHIRPGKKEAAYNSHCFIFVSGLEDIYNGIKEKGWDKITDITHYSWGTKGFCLTDLNGFTLEFCEWEC